jgi:hypothetical protein
VQRPLVLTAVTSRGHMSLSPKGLHQRQQVMQTCRVQVQPLMPLQADLGLGSQVLALMLALQAACNQAMSRHQSPHILAL